MNILHLNMKKLLRDGKVIFSRGEGNDSFKGGAVKDIRTQKSFVQSFSDDEDIQFFIDGLKKILFIGSTPNRNLKISSEMYRSLESDLDDLEEVSVSDNPEVYKLAYLFLKEKERFERDHA